MTELLNDVDTPSDAELISRVRGGDVAAYGLLFSRHKDAANRLARQLVRGPDSDDLVAEAFAKVLHVLQGGGGPDVAFRAYLLTAVRRLHVDRVRSGQRLQTTDDLTPFDPGVPFRDTAVAGFESGAAAKAFASLPERWQLVLWHLEVEGQKPADIAPLLGMSANSVSALAYRAREGLRQAFLTMHLSDISETECRWVNEHLGAFVRKGLAKRDAGKVQTHLDGCRRCTAMYLELDEVNSNLAAIIAPLLLGAAATGYLASGGGAGALGLLHLVSRAKDVAAVHTGGVVAGAVSLGVAAAAVVAIVVTQHAGRTPDVVADPPAGLTQTTAPVSPGSTPGTTPSAAATPRLSTAPSATLTPSTAPTGPAAGLSPSAALTTSAPTSASPSGILVPATGPASGTSGAPSSPAGDSPSASGGGTATDVPTDPVTDPAPPARVVGDPVVNADGTVTVSVLNLRATDSVEVAIGSHETTFAARTGVAGCDVVDARHVTCTPAATALRAAAGPAALTAAVSDLSVVLPLDFPGYMVQDDVQVTVSVNGGSDTTSVTRTFRPTRTPSFDFGAPTVPASPTHALSGDVDRFGFTTTAQLPPRVNGLVYHLSGAARFRDDGRAACTVSADATALTCPRVVDGDTVDLPVEATGLAAATQIGVSATPIDTITDPTPGDGTTTLVLRPGADLGLDLAVFSANPDRNGLVALTGTLGGVRPGLGTVTYTVGDGATFAVAGNPGCAPAGSTMTCPVPTDGAVSLTVRADHRNDPTPVSLGVSPGDPFDAVGTGPHTTSVTLPGRPVHDYSLSDLSRTGHSLSGSTDLYTLDATLGDLPVGEHTVSLSVTAGGTFAALQPDARCALDTSPAGGGQVTCTGVSGGDQVGLAVTSSTTATHDVSVRLEPTDPFDDPDLGDNSRTVSGLRPGTHLQLAPQQLGSLHQDGAGTYPVTLTVSGIRAGVDALDLGLDAGRTVVSSGTSACVPAGGRLVCTGLADGDQVTFSVRSQTPHAAGSLTVTAAPGGDFVELYDDNTATASLVPTYDFAMGDLVERDHTLAAGTDTYTLRSRLDALPAGLDALTFELTDGGSFAAAQDTGCARTTDTRVRCTGLQDGRTVDFGVSSTSTATHPTSVRLLVPQGYDDRTAADDSGTTTVRPGVDLHLASLDPDNASPANDDDLHLVATRLSGVRAGVGSVAYTLSGDASFVAADVRGCTVAARTVTCPNPTDGPITFTVRAGDPRATTGISIAVAAGAPFVELTGGDNADSARLTPRPTYDFGLGALSLAGHSLTGGTDHYTLRTTVRAVPDGLGTLGLVVTGGTVSAGQADGCTRVDDTHLSCGNLSADRTVDVRVDTTAGTRHDVGVAVVVPRGYVDPDPSDDADTLTVAPGVDLRLGAVTPADPLPAGDVYDVTTVLHGVRSGPVTLTVSGATVTDATCAVTSGTTVTCSSPAEGQPVRLSLRPTRPTASTPVTIRAAASDPFVELASADNTVGTTLSPDVVLESVIVTSHRDANQTDVVHAQLSGVPHGTTTVRIGLSGPSIGLAAGQVHLTDGAAGADGEGLVGCHVSDGSGHAADTGLFATCTRVDSDADGRFYVSMRVAHQHNGTERVTFAVIPVGVDEGAHTANNARTMSLT